jgi:hypothetical protein
MAVLVCASLWAIDWFFGAVTNVGAIREDVLRFRSEVAPLRMWTRHIVPNLNHVYSDVYRPEGEARLPRGTPRMFRSDGWSAISGSSEIAPAPIARIAFLGGSTTECNEVDEPYRFPASVATKLTTIYGLQVQTYNLGVRAHTTQDSITVLVNHPLMRQVSHVVLMHNINDRLWLATRGSYSGALSSQGESTTGAIIGAGTGLAHMLWDYIGLRSNMLFGAIRAVDRWRDARGAVPVDERAIDFHDSDAEASKRKFRSNLEVFVAAARAYGQVPILMTQPLGRPSDGQYTFNAAIRTVAAEKDVLLIDVAQLFGDHRNDLFFEDMIHLNNEGSLLVAEAVSKKLAGILGARSADNPNTGERIHDLEEAAAQCLPPPTSGLPLVPGPRRKVVVRSGRYPSVTSDLSSLVFHDWHEGAETIWVYDFRSKTYRELVGAKWAKNNRHPVSIPGSREIVFGSNRTGVERIYAVPLAGGVPSPLIDDASIGGSIPAADRGAVIFAGSLYRDGTPVEAPDLFEASRASRAVRRLTRTPWEEWRPVASRDGKYVYYIANEKGDFDVFRLKRDRPDERELVYRSSADEWDPALSEDNRWLAFASKQQGQWNLYLLDLLQRGSTAVPLTTGLVDDWDPYFIPNSRALLFASSDGRAPHIYLICPFGERLKPVK